MFYLSIFPVRQDSARRAPRPRRAAAMRQPSSGSAHKKNDDIGNEEQDLDALEFDGVLLQDRCASPNPPCDRGLRRPFFGSGVSCEGVCACRAMEEIKSGLMSEGRDFCFGCAFVCCASVGMIFFILYFDLPV